MITAAKHATVHLLRQVVGQPLLLPPAQIRIQHARATETGTVEEQPLMASHFQNTVVPHANNVFELLTLVPPCLIKTNLL